MKMIATAIPMCLLIVQAMLAPGANSSLIASSIHFAVRPKTSTARLQWPAFLFGLHHEVRRCDLPRRETNQMLTQRDVVEVVDCKKVVAIKWRRHPSPSLSPNTIAQIAQSKSEPRSHRVRARHLSAAVAVNAPAAERAADSVDRLPHR